MQKRIYILEFSMNLYHQLKIIKGEKYQNKNHFYDINNIVVSDILKLDCSEFLDIFH